MELGVRRVGLQSCYVALPPSVLEIVLAGNHLPSFPFVIELRPVGNQGGSAACFVAWDGAASSSTQIEVPEALAECLGLSTGSRVRVRARVDIVAAETVAVEPVTEDDWEILELNAEYLENHILSQVGVVTEGQQFPVWVAGHVVLALRVISTSPKGIVKLIPGAELVVAPKKRQVNRMPPACDVGVNESQKQDADLIPVKEAWLRVQELHSSFVQRLDLPGITYSTTPSTAIFISPTAAKVGLFEDGQLVVLSSGQGQTDSQTVGSKGKYHSRGASRDRQKGRRDGVAYAEEDLTEVDEETQHRDVIVRLKFWEGVAAGHVMVALPLRVFIGATIHMPVQIQTISLGTSVQLSSLVLSPVLFEPVEDDDGLGEGRSDDWDASAISRSLKQEANEIYAKESPQGKWQGHRHVLDAATGFVKEESTVPERSHDTRVSPLLMSWLDAQEAFSGYLSSGEKTQGVPISGEAIIHISIGSLTNQETLRERQLSHKFAQSSSMPEVFVDTGQMSRVSAKNFLFLLSAFSDTKGNVHNRRKPRLDGQQLSQRTDVSLANVLLCKEMLSSQSDASAEHKVPTGLILQQGLPCHLSCISGMNLEVVEGPALKSLTWLERPASEALCRLEVLLSPILRNKLKQLGTPLPGSVLLHGPPACGKTQLALALARELQDDERVLSHRVLVRCADLVGEQAMVIRKVLQDAVQDAMHHEPSLIILDDLDVLLPAAESEGPEPGIAVLSIAEFLADLIDICQGRRSNEFVQAAVAFLAVAKSSTALPACLCLSGRFDFHVQLSAPAAAERAAILDQIVASRGLRCSESVATRAAANCDGADASDMELLVDRAVHAAASRFLSLPAEQLPSRAAMGDVHMASGQQQILRGRKGIDNHAVQHIQNAHFALLDQDFNVALKEFVPLAMRGITKAGTQVAHLGWEDVGGLYDTRVALQEMLEMPVKYSKIFEQAPLRLRTGVLLYGPPGCGKTHIVGAAAAACSLRLISVKGPELLNKYIGASEQGVRDVFARATAAAPCILFFDEFDAIAPQRGHDNTGVTDRVVNQLLTELDGVEALNGVFVFAATSRPDLLDAALLRPGRLDRLLICDFPSQRERFEILEVLARKLSLADDVDLDDVASLTEGFSAADLQAVLSDAQLESVHTFLERTKDGIQEIRTGKPVITMSQLRSTAIEARPSVPENERRRLYGIYDAFIGAKRSLSSKRDVKGKRATLA